MKKKVSIVLPTYNGEKYLERAIRSCLTQTYGNIEVIVIDDCSSDGTSKIIAAMADPRLVRVRNERNRGLPKSLNRGFSIATGDYLTWTSDDNEYRSEAIRNMVSILDSDENVDFVYADVTGVYEDTGKTAPWHLPDEPQLSESNTVGACFLYRRKVYEAVGTFNSRLALVEDYDYWIRVSKTFQMYHIAQDLYVYRFHSSNLTETKRCQVKVMDAVVKYWHGLVPFRTLRYAFYHTIAFEVFHSLPFGKFCSIVGDILSRVARLSPFLAARLIGTLVTTWIGNRFRLIEFRKSR